MGRLYIILLLGFFLPLYTMDKSSSANSSEGSDEESLTAGSATSSQSSDWDSQPRIEPCIILPEPVNSSDQESSRMSPKRMPSAETLIENNSSQKLNIIQVTPETSFFEPKDPEGRLVTLDNFVYTLLFWKRKEFNTPLLLKAFHQIPVKEFNEFIEKHKEVFSEYLGIKSTTAPQRELTSEDIQMVRELSLKMLLDSDNEKIAILQNKHAANQLNQLATNQEKEALMKKYLKIRCFLMGTLPLTLVWALGATILALLKINS